MNKLVILIVIVLGLLYGTWKYYEPVREEMTIFPVRFLYKCYEDQEEEVNNYSKSDFEQNFYLLQSRDWCYQEFTERMKNLEKDIERAKIEKGIDDPYTQRLISGFEEAKQQKDMVRKFWYSRGWRKRWGQVLESDGE
jgi:hypothetical protein